MKSRLLGAVFTSAIIVVFTFSTPINATRLSIDAIDSGWYSDLGDHSGSNPLPKYGYDNDSYLVGNSHNSDGGWDVYRNFFVFDLSSINGTVTAASFHVYNSSNGYSSPDLTETYSVFDVATSTNILTTGGAGLISVFDDLGTGTVYGEETVSSANNSALVTVTMNANFIDAINNASGVFAFGGALTSITYDSFDERFFGFTGEASNAPNLTRQLILTIAPVPVPAAVWLFGSGLLGLIGVARRKKA